jgi:hypothetical protein
MALNYKIAPLDVETGGTLIEKHALLTLYICILSQEGQIVDEIDLKLMPDDGIFKVGTGPDCNVDPEALEVNGIDIDEHRADPTTVTYTVGRRMFIEFCKRNMSGKRSLRPGGHNILAFDVPMIMHALKISQEEWDELFHYRVVDTMPMVTMMQLATWLPDELGGQESLVKYYNVPTLKAHVAKNDTIMWVGVFLAMVRSLIDRKNGGGGTDELLILE